MGASVWKLVCSFVMPSGLILLLALGFLRPNGLPGWLQPLIGIFPLITLTFGLLFGWLFDRSRIVLAIFVLTLADRVLWLLADGGVSTTEVGRVVSQSVALLLPLNLLALSLIREDSLVTQRTGICAALMLLQPPLLIGLYRAEPSAFAASLEFALSTEPSPVGRQSRSPRCWHRERPWHCRRPASSSAETPSKADLCGR